MRYVESSLTRDGSHVPCIGRCILNQWTTRESPHVANFTPLYVSHLCQIDFTHYCIKCGAEILLAMTYKEGLKQKHF